MQLWLVKGMLVSIVIEVVLLVERKLWRRERMEETMVVRGFRRWRTGRKTTTMGGGDGEEEEEEKETHHRGCDDGSGGGDGEVR